jgi:histidinol-phosphate/aromatic aminotransferase/cobyric acid decarboxylase-like protein
MGGYGLPKHLRISVGLEHENRRLVSALEQVLGNMRRSTRDREATTN